MKARESFVLALRRLRHRPVRSLLLLQGTVLAVAVALLPPAVIGGTRRAALERAGEVGADRITFAADPTAADGLPLAVEDVEALRAAATAAGARVEAAAGLAVETAVPQAGSPPVTLVRSSSEAPRARGLVLAAGRTLDPAAPPGTETVLEARLADALGAKVGSTVRLSADAPSAGVVGVLAPRSDLQRRTNDVGYDVEHPTYRAVTGGLLAALGVPHVEDAWKRTDACAYLLRGPVDRRVDWIYLRTDPRDVRAAARAGQEALAARRKDAVALYPFVYPLVLSDELRRFDAANVALFLSCLVMGAVVMASLGLLAAVRRAPEVAVHRVEGATKGDVALQFLFEGAVLSAAGALLGLPVALGLATLRVSLEPTAGFAWAFPWREAALATSIAVVVGTLASVLPAWRAASADPVEGLADE